MVRGEIAFGPAERHRLLEPHHDRVGKAAQEHDKPQDHVHDPDALVVDCGEPFLPQISPETIFGDQAEHRDAAKDDADEGDDKDRLVQRKRLHRQLAEDRTGFGCGMRDGHGNLGLVQDSGRSAAAGARSAVRSGLEGCGSPSPFSFSGATGFASGRSFDITGALQ